jgi:NAD-dependent deacetylase
VATLAAALLIPVPSTAVPHLGLTKLPSGDYYSPFGWKGFFLIMALQVSARLQSLLGPQNRVVVFTGAGVSVESGIPTFRGAEGLWNRFRAEELATMEAFQANPKLVWEWYNSRRENMLQVEPNPGHFAIAAFERHFQDFMLVTQNIDGLHERAGTQKILKLHGDIWEVRCLECGLSRTDRTVPMEPLPPRCPCGGLLRVGVVWFGEELPLGVYENAMEVTRNCDLFFSVGTSAVVYPAAYLPQLAKNHGAYVVEVNIEPSAVMEYADEFLQGKSGELMPLIQKALPQV